MQRDHGGPLGLYGCHGLTTQRWRMMKDGVISNGVSCIHHTVMQAGSCTTAPDFDLKADGTVRIEGLPNSCFTAIGEWVFLQTCVDASSPVGLATANFEQREV